MNNFAAFILTHGRPHKVYTYNLLRKSGYKGKIYLIVDDEDDSYPEYLDLYGDQVIQFSKSEIAKTFDEFDNFSDRRTIVYARNSCFQIAEDLGLEYFIQLDDDYTSFRFKFDHNRCYGDFHIKNLGTIFKYYIKFLETTPVTSVSFYQNGDFLGGSQSGEASSIKLKRKAMNSFFCSVKKPFKFVGRINEDVNTYVSKQSSGLLFVQTNHISLKQKQTQSNSGGMTDIYLDSGTYIKSFYSVIAAPSCVTVQMMASKNPRLHHHINWNNAVPKILSSNHFKK